MRSFEDILADIFKVPASSVTDSMSSKDIPAWDSMNYLLFISALEKEFKLSFTMDEVMGAETVGDIRKVVEARGTKP
jgi:acyl carrier protein